MLKLVAIFLVTILVAVSYGSLLGGYSDHPELLEDEHVKGIANYAVEHLARTQNLLLDHIKITRVETQTVAGINYKLDFTGEPMKDGNGKVVTCQVIIYIRFDATRQITKAQCHTE